MKTMSVKPVTLLTIVCAIALTIVSWFGVFDDTTYARDAASMAAQGIGQDMVDLFLVVPLLLFSFFLMRRGNIIFTLLFGGTVFYITYSFFIYCFGVHFNRLFLLYCVVLGTSFYLLILVLIDLHQKILVDRFPERLPNKSTAIFFIVIALLFYLIWLKDVLPAVIHNAVPKSVSDYQLLVNPVHVLDMAIALPGLVAGAVLLFKKHKMGFILAPVFLVFFIILTIALVAMVVMLKVKGISDDISAAVIFVLLSVISFFFLGSYLRKLR